MALSITCALCGLWGFEEVKGSWVATISMKSALCTDRTDNLAEVPLLSAGRCRI